MNEQINVPLYFYGLHATNFLRFFVVESYSRPIYDNALLLLRESNYDKIHVPDYDHKLFILQLRWPSGIERPLKELVVDLSLIPSRVKPMTLTLVFTAFLLGAQP